MHSRMDIARASTRKEQLTPELSRATKLRRLEGIVRALPRPCWNATDCWQSQQKRVNAGQPSNNSCKFNWRPK